MNRQPGTGTLKEAGAGRTERKATTNRTSFTSKTSTKASKRTLSPSRRASSFPPALFGVRAGGGRDRILSHGGGLRAVGVGSALPRRRVRAGLCG
jgi:hypothetical protein